MLTDTYPAIGAAAVSPSDTVDLATPSRAIYVGVAGNISVDFLNGETAVVLVGVAAGTLLPIQVKRVRATATTATSIVALY